MSAIEAVTNIVIGYAIAVVTQMIVFPLFGYSVTLADNLAIGLVFTLVSIIRSYSLRRLFERIRVKQARHER